MSPNKVIEGPYLADILEQPQAIRATLEALSGKKPKVPRGFRNRLIVMTGMGTSLYALHPLNIRLNEAGFQSVVIEASELLEHKTKWLTGKALVAVSQSGRSAEIVKLLRGRPKDCPVVGVTNDATSPLAERSDWAIETKAGSEHYVSTKTYLATLGALSWFGDVLLGEPVGRSLVPLRRAADEVERYLAAWPRHVGALSGLLEGVRHLFYLGRGGSLASAQTAGLITKESTHFQAEGMSAGAFRHGPFEMVGASTLAIVFEGSGNSRAYNVRLMEDLRKVGGRAELIGKRAVRDCLKVADASHRVRPLLEILPVQMMTLTLAAMAGREAGRFSQASKVTTTL